MAASAALATGCSHIGGRAAGVSAHPTTRTAKAPQVRSSAPATTASTSTTATTDPPSGPAGPVDGQPPSVPAALDGGPVILGPLAAGPLSAKTIAVDPGHNGGNSSDPSYVNSTIFNGREDETCDTTGTETDGGYTEALFNFNVASYLEVDLRRLGATVVLTRSTNTGVGPCVTERAAIANQAHADAAISIHADGGPASGRGFAILEPVADGPNDAVISSSQALGQDLRAAFAAGTGEPYSTYDGIDAIQPRNDLGGINLTTVPKVFIECANMRNATDAALVVQPAWQARAAEAIAEGFETFLAG